MNSKYQGNLQERLGSLSTRTNCPTRQENGQRYLGPPVDWNGKPPNNSEVFISKLPPDCFEDEIYDFCCQAGKIYLLRLMINFENENRGFCFVTYSNTKEASTAVSLLPQKSLRKGLYVHAEISLNNCTLKMYGLDFRWNDELLEQEIRANTKDVVNVTIRRNMSQRTLMATLFFDTHQKAAVARRKLSQIANSRWGQNVKVFLWSKKSQKNKQDGDGNKQYQRSMKTQHYESSSAEIESEELVRFRDELSPWSSPSSLASCKSDPYSVDTSLCDKKYCENSHLDVNNNLSGNYYLVGSNPFTFPSAAALSLPKKATELTSHNIYSPPHSTTSASTFDPFMNWNTDMFPRPTNELISELQSPLDDYDDNYSSYDIHYTARQIEIILQEGLAALGINCCNQNVYN